MLRGEVWHAVLPEPEGSETGYDRPVVIVQSDTFSAVNLRTVIVVPFTTNLKLAAAPGNVLIRAAEAVVPFDSVANISGVGAIDRRFLVTRYGSLSDRIMDEIDFGLRQWLELL